MQVSFSFLRMSSEILRAPKLVNISADYFEAFESTMQGEIGTNADSKGLDEAAEKTMSAGHARAECIQDAIYRNKVLDNAMDVENIFRKRAADSEPIVDDARSNLKKQQRN